MQNKVENFNQTKETKLQNYYEDIYIIFIYYAGFI